MSNDGGGAALAIVGLVAAVASSGVAAFFVTQQKDDEQPAKKTQTEEDVVVITPDEIIPSNCEGDTKTMKKGCHNTETGEVYDGTPGKCGQGKELWVPDPEAPGYKAAFGDGTCEGELRDCSVDCPAPCSGGQWEPDPDDYCKVITYDDSNPPQKITKHLDGVNACGTGVISTILNESRGNFVEAKGLGGCEKERIGACTVECPPGMPETDGCAYYANRQLSANGCMKVDANGNALEYKPDKSNNVECGESGKQEYFYLPVKASGCNKLSSWEPCSGPPCPIDCVGKWRQESPSNPEGWEPCTGNCGQQPQKKRQYHISNIAQHGGKACPYSDEFKQTTNCGSITPCTVPCEGSWSEWSTTCPTCDTSATSDSRSRTWNTSSTLPTGYVYSPACPTPSTETEYCPATSPCCEVGPWQDGTCRSDGYMTKTRTLTENKPGACGTYDSETEVRCCYQAGDWETDGQVCGHYQAGKMKYKQTVAGNCEPGTDTKYEDCQNCVQKGQIGDRTYCVRTSANYKSLPKKVHPTRRVTITPASGGGIACEPEYTSSGGPSYTATEPDNQMCTAQEGSQLRNAYNAGYPDVSWSDCGSLYCFNEMYRRNN
jgi:hypothetical protein